MIHVEELHKAFGPVQAVGGISFDIKKGEVVGLLGPNGAGKTTTMRLIVGYLKPDVGVVSVADASVEGDPTEARRHIGYLPENAPLYSDLEVTEFLDYVACLREIAPEKREKGIKDIVGICGLENVVGRPIGQLSRGYKQRVGLAQALIHNPPVMIFDEPTTGLDPHQIQEIRNLIKEIGKERTVILSTHIMQEVEATCSRALIISRGKLVGQGTLEELVGLGRRGGAFTATIRAPRREIEEKIRDLNGFSIEKCYPLPDGNYQRVELKTSDGTGAGAQASEAIFHWVVENHWALTELTQESSSLEEVFLELTRS